MVSREQGMDYIFRVIFSKLRSISLTLPPPIPIEILFRTTYRQQKQPATQLMLLLLLWFFILFTHFDYILETHIILSTFLSLLSFFFLYSLIVDYFLYFFSGRCFARRCLRVPVALLFNHGLWLLFIKMIGIDPNKDEVILNARTEDITTSYLIIQKADVSDTGKYTCAPSNSAPTSINVHVLHGKWGEGRQPDHFL